MLANFDPAHVVAALISVGIGMVITTQATFLAGMTAIMGNPLSASAISFTVGLGTLSMLVLGQYGRARHVGTLEPVRWAGVQWWELLGGPLGAMELTSRAFIAERIGLTPQAVANITGQMIVSLYLDHIAFLGLPHKAITARRIGGAFAVIGGCMVSAAEKMSASTSSVDVDEVSIVERLLLMALAVFAGSCLPVQAGVNRKLGERFPNCYSLRLPATLTSFFFGYLSLYSLLIIVQFGMGRDVLVNIPGSIHLVPWYQYIAGVIGILYVGGGVVLAPIIGVGGFMVSGVLGQLSLGIVLDAVGIEGRQKVPITFASVFGALMVFVGALCITLAPAKVLVGKPETGEVELQGAYAEFDAEKPGA
eukprot:CAMPEP_0206225904 /NCGR_PEP_ID=MMETSP0047_2-20121206/7794_1 /ASSEMBLY_ACC=CAM_ASM_000192 /TAXON_ID=195065 /ORGANISM="Chroomonas mesostigmatica_cf, Strain CCMP1168" /LENGTH=363 /DNA_ID=CAMNT_0053648931 /DNA_START=64 /DNA_END=1152 /DNA_ORIENTATION=-